MKSAVLFETGKPLEVISSIKIPELLKGQVQVKVIYSGLCHSQLMEINGGRGEDKYLPHLLGHEGVGIVEEVGECVSKVKEGDKVIITWMQGDGLNAPGGLYPHNGYVINSGSATTLTEQTIVAENRLVKIPNKMPIKHAFLFGCALPTGFGLVFNELQLPDNQKIAIFGLGGIGMSALIATSMCKPKQLIAIDINPAKLQLAQEFGATHSINASDENPVEAVLKLTNGGVDYSIEASGLVKTIEQAFKSVREKGGQCIFGSHPKHDHKICLEPFAFHKGKNIRGSWGGGVHPDRDFPVFMQKIINNNIDLDLLISREYTLDEVNQACDDLVNRNNIRIIINTQSN